MPHFFPQGGIDSVTQKGNVVYSKATVPPSECRPGETLAHYIASDQMLVLTGDPRVANGGMQTTANTIRINRATGEAIAEGDVKSTYSELKELPNGALLASSSPIHVTAPTMTAHNNPGIASTREEPGSGRMRTSSRRRQSNLIGIIDL